MSDPRGPLPLHEVLGIVERRRRRRARAVAVAGPTAAVAAAGVAGLIVVAIQSGTTTSTSVATAPSTSVAAPSTEPGRRTVTPGSRELDPSYARSGYVEELADALPTLDAEAPDTGTPDPRTEPWLEEARILAAAWEVTQYPAAKAILAKAALTGTVLDPDDPGGADELVSRFAQAGYTDDYAQVLAGVWGTDPRTAKIIGALVAEVSE